MTGLREAIRNSFNAGNQEADCRQRVTGLREAIRNSFNAGNQEADWRQRVTGLREAIRNSFNAGNQEADWRQRVAGLREAIRNSFNAGNQEADWRQRAKVISSADACPYNADNQVYREPISRKNSIVPPHAKQIALARYDLVNLWVDYKKHSKNKTEAGKDFLNVYNEGKMYPIIFSVSFILLSRCCTSNQIILIFKMLTFINFNCFKDNLEC